MVGTVFISNSQGHIGRVILTLLQEANIPVRVLCSKWQDADTLRSQGVEAGVAHFNATPDELISLLKGCDTAILVEIGNDSLDRGLINAAIMMATRHVIQVAPFHAVKSAMPQNHSVPSQTVWTLVRHDVLMQEILVQARLIRKGLLLSCYDDARALWVDARDVATEVRDLVVEQPGHHGNSYIVVGPDILDMLILAKRLSSIVGHRVHYIFLPESWLRLVLRILGLKNAAIHEFLGQLDNLSARNRKTIQDRSDGSKIVGNSSFNEFVATHKSVLHGLDIVPILVAILGLAMSLTTLLLFMQ